MRHLIQPEGSGLCGQTCIAMAADVSLDRACDVVGHRKLGGTTTREVVHALRELGVPCASSLKRISRLRPVLPKRCIVAIHRPKEPGRHRGRWHWMLHWDGRMFDPGDAWPEAYRDWRITSVLEIYE